MAARAATPQVVASGPFSMGPPPSAAVARAPHMGGSRTVGPLPPPPPIKSDASPPAAETFASALGGDANCPIFLGNEGGDSPLPLQMTTTHDDDRLPADLEAAIGPHRLLLFQLPHEALSMMGGGGGRLALHASGRLVLHWGGRAYDALPSSSRGPEPTGMQRAFCLDAAPSTDLGSIEGHLIFAPTLL